MSKPSTAILCKLLSWAKRQIDKDGLTELLIHNKEVWEVEDVIYLAIKELLQKRRKDKV